MGIRHPHKPSEYPNLLLYVLDETHVTVTVATALALLWTRRAHVAYFTASALASTQFAKLMKRFIREARPPPPPPGGSKQSRIRPKKTYGMPSTHATALSFYHGYLLPLTPALTSYLLGASSRGASTASMVLGAGLTLLWGMGIWSRVQLGYHTWAQVIGGGVLGEALGHASRIAWRANPGWEPQLQRLINWGWGITLGRILS